MIDCINNITMYCSFDIAIYMYMFYVFSTITSCCVVCSTARKQNMLYVIFSIYF